MLAHCSDEVPNHVGQRGTDTTSISDKAPRLNLAEHDVDRADPSIVEASDSNGGAEGGEIAGSRTPTGLSDSSEVFGAMDSRHITSEGKDRAETLNPTVTNEATKVSPTGQTSHTSQLDDIDSTPRSEVPLTNSQYSANGDFTVQDYFAPSLPHFTSSAATDLSSRQAAPSSVDRNLLAPDVDSRPIYHRDLSTSSTASTNTIRPFHPAAPLVSDSGLPVYPNQAYSALHTQHYPPAYIPRTLRSRDSGSSQVTYRGPAASDTNLPSQPMTDLKTYESRSTANSPVSTPSLFTTPKGSPGRAEGSDEGFYGAYSSPYLHHTQRHVPKETHRADIDVDPISGRKLINHYEIVDELGRGVHGKVKLGRDLEATGSEEKYVAIKIVERISRRKRLGKSGNHEAKIKREIAILKKARHPNIVGLLEVIDDPKRKKVYIVLEHVEMGEIRWRTDGPTEICLVEWRRYQRELQAKSTDPTALAEDETIIVEARNERERLEKERWKELNRQRELGSTGNFWSHEYGGETDNEESVENGGMSRSSTGSELIKGKRLGSSAGLLFVESDPALETAIHDRPVHQLHGGENYLGGEAAQDDSGRQTPSQARADKLTSDAASDHSVSSLDSNSNGVPEHFRYVPLMELEAARAAFRDTILGLEFLHFQGVVHRDIKPANLLQAKDHHIKISDFGVSYLGRGHPDDPQSESDTAEDSEAVELAKTVGTPAFYAPELCALDDENSDRKPWKVTNQIDIWALGVTLYCLTYGRVPFHDNNTFALMRCIAEDEVHIPRQRLKAVDDYGNSKSAQHARVYHMRSGNRRAPHDLEYEPVDDMLYDLLKRLLIKDPEKRIKLTEVKHHPWVLAGIHDPAKWIAETDPAREAEGKKIEVSKEDVEEAVAPINIVDRVKSGVKKVAAALGISRNGSRRRARSSTTSLDHQPESNASSSSDIRQISRSRLDQRRPSLKPEDIAAALKASRDTEHPLSQSVTASPDVSETGKFFSAASASRPVSPGTQSEASEASVPRRPALPERMHSSVAAVGGTHRPLRSVDLSANIPEGAMSTSALPSTPLAIENHHVSTLHSIFGGAREKMLRTVRSRERNSFFTRDRAFSVDQRSEDGRGEPSLGVSNAVASGIVHLPDMLRDDMYSGSSANPSPAGSHAGSRAPSVASEQPPRGRWDPRSDVQSLSRQSSTGSMSHTRHHLNVPGSLGSTYEPFSHENEGQYSRSNPISSSQNDLRMLRAQQEQIRRRKLEEVQEREKAEKTMSDQQSLRSPVSEVETPISSARASCPPSPDDLVMAQQRQRQFLPLMEPLPAPSTPLRYDATQSGNTTTTPVPIPNVKTHKRGTGSSSSEERFPSAISQSTLHPSDPSVVSAASSVSLTYGDADADDDDDDEDIGLYMARNHNSNNNTHNNNRISSSQGTDFDTPSYKSSYAMNNAEHNWNTDHEHAAHYERYSDDDDDYDDDDEDEGFIEMVRYKSNVAKPA